jgi:hypothetical protein
MRLIPHILTLALAAFGCQAATVTGPGWGEVPEGPGGGEDPGEDPGVDPIEEGADPQQVFLEQVLPLLDLRCNDCHTDIATAPVFIDPVDPYASILESGVISIGDPGASSLVTKGAHRGPAWQAAEAQVVSDWIRLEAGVPGGGNPDVGGGGGAGGGEEEEPEPEPDPVVGDYETSPQTVVDGDNVIDLDEAGLPGAELHFFAQRVALGLHISSVTIYAGDDGLVVNHPTFITHVPGGDSTPDPEDRFSTLELVVPAAGAALLADNVLLVDFPTDGELSVSFVSASTL